MVPGVACGVGNLKFVSLPGRRLRASEPSFKKLLLPPQVHSTSSQKAYSTKLPSIMPFSPQIQGVESLLQDTANLATTVTKNYELVKHFVEVTPTPTMRRAWTKASDAALAVAKHRVALGPTDVKLLNDEFER
ncbi:hypothetical protein K474DRAFT_463941 [Panus rudis PR-1116 ss-1]|nr:hypothetical protein K474DRAFT_463941 [Panus rudis PR-1116 ss-1]